MRPERKAGADADGKIKGRLIKDWSITDEDSNSICISASWKHKKIIDEIAKTNDVELIDATQTVEKDLAEYDLIGLHQEYMVESSISRCLSLHQSISQTIKCISYLYIWRQTCL